MFMVTPWFGIPHGSLTYHMVLGIFLLDHHDAAVEDDVVRIRRRNAPMILLVEGQWRRL
jgi:hypothetical protein